MKHSQIILNIMAERGISAYKLAKETKISESLFSKWKKNPTSEISSYNLACIADYLDCPVDYLLGRTNDATNYKKNNPLIVTDEEAALNEELISRLVQLTPEEQTKVGAFVLGLLASRANGASRPASGE